MELVGSSAGGFGLSSAGLGTCQSAKNKCVDIVYSHGASYKKPKKPAASILVELSAGSLCLEDLGGNNSKLAASWRSRVGSVSGSVSGFLDVENLENLVAEKTSYVDLEQSLKASLFATMNNNNDDSMLPSPKISRSNQLSSSNSHVFESHSFGPVKLFALDVNLLAVSGRTNRASTPSKFPGVICSTFTSEFSLIKARKLTVCENIVVNSNLKKTNICLNREVIIKEIPVDLSKLAVESVFSKFGKIVSIKMQLIGLWQKALIEFESLEVATLLYTLLVGTSAHDLSDLLVLYGEKTCFIGCNLGSYVHNWCTIICFENKDARLAAVSTILIFKSISLYWACLVLASCIKCEQFGHTTANCPVGGSSGVHGKRVVFDQDQICLTGIYKKKSASIARPVLFGGKTWAQVASGIFFCVSLSGSSGFGLCSGSVPPSVVSDYLVVSCLNNCLAVLECSLELLADRVSGILVRLNSFGVVPLVPFSLASPLFVSAALILLILLPPITIDAVVNLSISSSKVFTAKVGGLETKLVALKALVGLVLDKLNLLCSGLGLSAPTSSQ
ncbi:hypothetical protein G9A89_011710 [Geosiphon pyriformis]|nr:hypothetical protein G9A89_011710 [Geosiphon pyriformis]